MKQKNSQNHPLEGQNKYRIGTIGKKTKNENKTQTDPPSHQHVLMESRNMSCMYLPKGRELKLTCNLRYRISWLQSALPCNLNIV